jgi:HlyD family secretion protein
MSRRGPRPLRWAPEARTAHALGLSVILLIAVSLGACQDVGAQQSAVPTTETTRALTASGTIRATEIRLASELGGRVTVVNVREGEAIQSGQVLVSLDTTPWDLQLLQADAAVGVARSDLVVLRAGPRAEEIAAARAKVAAAEAQRDGLYTAWQNALDLVDDPQDLVARIVDARSQVVLAEQAVELAKAQLAQVQMNRDIRSEGSTERKAADYQVLASEHALAAAEADQATAQALLDHLRWISAEPLGYIAQADAAQGQYEAAAAAVEVTRAQLADVLAGPTSEEVAVSEAKLVQAEAQAEYLRVKIDRCTIVSPIDGVVMAKVVQAGELAAPAATLLTLADLRTLTLEVYVPEDQVGRVQLDQRVRVTVDAFPEQTFEGRVTKIGSEPEFTPRNVATAEERRNTFYAAEIELANPDGLLKPGMPADAVFVP